LLLPNGSGLSRLGLPDRVVEQIQILPANGVVNHVARSPDGSRLAVARFSRPETDRVGGSDVLVVPTEGGAPILTIGRDRPGDLAGAPAWLADGGLVLERQSAAGPVGGSRIERFDANGGARRVIVDRASSPTVSPDSQLLAYIRSEGGDRLMIRSLTDDDEREVVNRAEFAALAYPRFSPDGGWLAFSAVGGPSAAPVGRSVSQQVFAFATPGDRLVRAHGLPWDIWVVRPDGSELRRLTTFGDDDASVAWSPDGRWIAIYSGESTTAVAADGSAIYCLLGSGGIGGFEWLER
jgi:Tol biopolymer transport system component